MTFKTFAATVALCAGAAIAGPVIAADKGSLASGNLGDIKAAPERQEKTLGRYTGWEGKERDLGLIMNMVVKTLEDKGSYQHETNDALVKSLLSHMQFAKDQKLVKEAVEAEIKTQAPMLKRAKRMMDTAGDKDMALKAVFDQTTCHWQLVLDTQSEPGLRRWKSPYGNVLKASTRLGQFDIDEKWIHENWTIPRMQGYAKLLGVDFEVSPWQDDGMITVRVKGYAPPKTAANTVSQ
jgi:hypothetical protein